MTPDPTGGFPVSSYGRGSALSVTVVPRAGQSSIQEAPDGTLRVRIAALPVEGAANTALLRFLAETLDIPRSQIEVVSGKSSRRKRIGFEGTTPADLQKRLRDALGRDR